MNNCCSKCSCDCVNGSMLAMQNPHCSLSACPCHWESENKNPPTENPIYKEAERLLEYIYDGHAHSDNRHEIMTSLSTETEKAREEGRDKLIAFLEQRDYKLQPEHTLNELLHDYMERESARATKDK